jgi:cytoskeletal protein CcmA (bactofilin family)
MALWKEPVAPKRDSALLTPDPIRRDDPTPVEAAPSYEPRRQVASREVKESVIGSDITIEGKIDGTGHIRIAGRFKGDVNVEGNLTIEHGARLTGGVKANAVTIAGELEGNILDASRVELLESGVMNGDLKAGTFTVAAGSRMRGRVEFGWDTAGQHHASPNGEANGEL